MSVCVCFLVEFIQQTKERLGRSGTVTMMTDLQHVTSTCIRLQDMLSKLLDYTDSVVVSSSVYLSCFEHVINCHRQCMLFHQQWYIVEYLSTKLKRLLQGV